MTLTAHQQSKFCLNFITQIHGTELYDSVKELLNQWKHQHKSPQASIVTFIKIAQTIAENDQQILEEFNRCLVKEYAAENQKIYFQEKQKIKEQAQSSPHANAVLDTFSAWMKTETIPLLQPVQAHQSIPPPVEKGPSKLHQIEELSESEFINRLERHRLSKQIAKILFLYRRSVITVREFKSLLEPIYLSDPSFFNMLFQFAEESESKRRKITIFAPLNELVDQKYPMDQVGNSYVIIPDGYANWSTNWKKNQLENVMNRLCVSVPLGSEVSFVIMRKNEYEEQLFKNEEEKYQIDSNIQCLKATIRLIERNKKLTGPLIQRILSGIYPNQILNALLKSQNPQITKCIILPRLQQKLNQILKCRAKFQKVCEDIHSKNYYKSLDYRCFYFCKNDKKFNCQTRWEKEISMRKKQIVHDNDEFLNPDETEIEDRESLQRPRNYVFNSFDNITKQQFLQNRKVDFTLYDRKKQSNLYPKFPDNQILFLIGFQNEQVLNDVLQILLSNCQKKSTFELMILKMLKKSIVRRLTKDTNILNSIDSSSQGMAGNNTEKLNEVKSNKKVYRDINDQFYDLIEEEIEPAKIEDSESPFEGPIANTFIGTKQNYFFIRFLGTIYQRFLKAKYLSDQRLKAKVNNSIEGNSEESLYNQFVAILIFKLKEQKYFEEYLRKIFQQDAFIFFTLDKLISGVTKLINNIGVDSLTFKILKEDSKDYDLEIKRWADYRLPSITSQLSRVFKESESLFRFSYSEEQKLVYISEWENQQIAVAEPEKKKKQVNSDNSFYTQFLGYLCNTLKAKEKPKQKAPKLKYIKQQNEHIASETGAIIPLQQHICINVKRKPSISLHQIEAQLCRAKKMLKKI